MTTITARFIRSPAVNLFPKSSRALVPEILTETESLLGAVTRPAPSTVGARNTTLSRLTRFAREKMSTLGATESCTSAMLATTPNGVPFVTRAPAVATRTCVARSFASTLFKSNPWVVSFRLNITPVSGTVRSRPTVSCARTFTISALVIRLWAAS